MGLAYYKKCRVKFERFNIIIVFTINHNIYILKFLMNKIEIYSIHIIYLLYSVFVGKFISGSLYLIIYIIRHDTYRSNT